MSPAKANYEIRLKPLQGFGMLPSACCEPCLPAALQLSEAGGLTRAVLHPLPPLSRESCSLVQEVRVDQGIKGAGKVVMFANCSV